GPGLVAGQDAADGLGAPAGGDAAGRNVTAGPDPSGGLDPSGELRELAGDCVHCGFCLPACPSGVRYDRLIEAARSWSEEPPAGTRPVPARSLRDRAVRTAIFETFPYPRRLRLLTAP